MIMKTFIHTQTEGRYIVTHVGKMKVDGTWFESVSYVPENRNDTNFYTRTVTDFNDEFEPVLDCEQDDLR